MGRDFAVLAAAIAGGSLFTMAQLARDVGARADALIEALGWIPLAWPARAINAARRGDEVPALAWLVASAMLTVVLHAAWISLSHFLLLNGERSAQGRRRSNRSILSGASTRFGAAFARQWIYLRRSPNNRVGFVYGTVFGIAFAMVQIVQQGEGNGAAAAFGILLAMMANLGAATNVLGFDAGSLWIEVLAGGPGRPHMMARQLIALPNLLLPTWLSGIVVGIWTGEWTLVLLVSMLAIPIALNVLTFGMVASALAPAPLPDWDNPFGNRQSNEGRGLRLVIIALVGMVSVTVLSAPISHPDLSFVWQLVVVAASLGCTCVCICAVRSGLSVGRPLSAWPGARPHRDPGSPSNELTTSGPTTASALARTSADCRLKENDKDPGTLRAPGSFRSFGSSDACPDQRAKPVGS